MILPVTGSLLLGFGHFLVSGILYLVRLTG